MDPIADEGVQPEGQGAATGDAPYQEYLDRIPEQVRGEVEPVFKDWDSNVTKRFQEQAQYRSQWEPYEQAGISQYNPQELQQLVEFANAIQDPEWFRTWLQEQAVETGAFPQGPGEEPVVDPALEQLLQQHLTPLQHQLQEQQSWQQQQEERLALEAAAQHIEQQFAGLREKHGDFDQGKVEMFASKYLHDDPHNAIDRGFADYQAFIGQIERGLLTTKLGHPASPEMGGGPAANTPGPLGLKGAEEATRAWLRTRNSA